MYPADFMLVASANPCPCGYFGDQTKNCHCTPKQIANYRRRLSGPIIDRIDLHVAVPQINWQESNWQKPNESSNQVKKRIESARRRQQNRFRRHPFLTNADMTGGAIKAFCPLTTEPDRLLSAAAGKLALSARSYFRILKLARTIADLNQAENISADHIAEALQYRPKL